MARVLVVDDERSIRITLREFLRDAGHEVFVAEDADEALDMLTSDTDVVVSDIILPRMTGVRLLEMIKETSPDVQVVLMTGEPTVETASEAVRAGAFDYISKPIGKETLLKTVANAVRIKSLEDQQRRLEEDNRKYREELEKLVEERTAAWRKSEQRMELAVRGADLGTWDRDLVTDNRIVNERWAEMLGYELHEIEHRRDAHRKLVHPDDRESQQTALEDHLSGKTDSYEIAVRMLHKSGEWIWVLDKGRVLERDAQGTPLRICGTHLDITRRKKAEDGMRELESHAHQVQKMEAIGTLAGGIAHDFNNILGAMMGYIQLAMDSLPPSSEPYEYLTEIDKAGGRATDLVRQILAVSRPGTPERRPIKLNLVVEEALNLLRETIPSTIEFRCDVSPDCGLVMADASQVHQVTMNLCTNAYQAMRESGGTLTVKLDEIQVDPGSGPEAESRCVRLSISDTGKGMAQDTIARIFEPYFTTKEIGEGTGLGLATVLSIVEDHGGVVSARSTPGSGSEFEVRFPVHLVQDDTEGEATAETRIPRGNGEQILFVDDEPAIVAAHSAILRGLGYQVTGFTASPEALEAFRAEPDGFDLVITDQTMPEMTGLEVATEMLRVRPNLPILMCTGYSETVDQQIAMAAGLRGYILKPIVPGDLARTIRSALDEAGPSKSDVEQGVAAHLD